MPRVVIKKDDYRQKDFRKLLKVKMAENEYTQTELAGALDTTQSALSYKMKESSYSLEDFRKLIKILNFTDEEIIKSVR